MRTIRITGTGSALPGRIVTNKELEQMVETSDEWIRERTGIGERHVSVGETVVTLASEAARKALEQAGKRAEEIDLILVVCTYDRNPNRQGYRDVLHIIQEIYGRYAKNPLVRIKADSGGARGGPWSVKYPIKWVTQQEDTHPYYFGAMSLKFEAPAVRQEVPFT